MHDSWLFYTKLWSNEDKNYCRTLCSWPTYSSVAGPPTHHRDVWKHRSKAEGKGWRLEGG
jgi:hypothetical protein